MAKMFRTVAVPEPEKKGTSQGKKPITSTMNKNKRKCRTKKQIRRSRRRSR